jgi:hypothetical protein
MTSSDQKKDQIKRWCYEPLEIYQDQLNTINKKNLMD